MLAIVVVVLFGIVTSCVVRAFHFPGVSTWHRSPTAKSRSFRPANAARDLSVSDPQNINLEKFAGLIRSDWVRVNGSDLLDGLRKATLPLPNAVVEAVVDWPCDTTQNETTLSLDRVSVVLLPADIAFPTFADNKQRGYAGQNVLILRESNPAENDNRELSRQRLLDGDSAVWIGHPGIGKTTEVNSIIVQLLKNLGNEGWPRRLAHRVGGRIVIYTRNETACRVDCSTANGQTLADVEQFCRLNEADRDVVLVLELGETEADPMVAPVPTLIALSSRDVSSQLKTMKKGGQTRQFLRGPHRDRELLLAARIIYLTDRARAIKMAGFSPDTDEETFVRLIGERMDEAGPLARTVLSGINFEEFLERRRSSDVQDRVVDGEFRNLHYDSLPGDSKYFIAAYPVNSTMQPNGGCVFKLLSPRAAIDLSCGVKDPESISA